MKHCLWNKYSVWEAFEIAKEDIRRLINVSEASKYKMMISETITINGKTKKCEHKWFPIINFKEGKLTKTEVAPIFDWIPSNVECFQGRQQEMYEVITLLNNKRLVNILGPPGIGKKNKFRQKFMKSYKRQKEIFWWNFIYWVKRMWVSSYVPCKNECNYSRQCQNWWSST